MDDMTTHRHRGGLLSRSRLATALVAGKLAGNTGRFLRLGGGTNLPGEVARKIDPQVLRKVIGESAAFKVVVCGSNGKTTTCRMLAALVQAAGQRVAQNRTGSNLLPGVVAVAVNEASLFGNLDADAVILEIDEATTRLTVPDIEPDVVIVNNLFRDQLDRYGEIYAVAAALEKMIDALPAETTVILNADDPLVASFAPDARAKRLYFGVSAEDVGTPRPEHASDSIRCPRCRHDLDYERAYISHMGNYHCPNCGFERPPLDIAVTHASLQAMSATDMQLQTPIGPLEIHLSLPGMHNIYNAAGAIAGAIGVGLDLAEAPAALAQLKPVFGRLEEIHAGDKRIVLSFVKNPTSYNTTLRTILQEPARRHILSAHSNTPVDGEDFSWFWDIDLEEVAPQIVSLVTSGTKAEELAVRFKYAGVAEDLMQTIPDLRTALDAALARVMPGEMLYVLSGYAPTMALRKIMQQRGWVPPFWRE
jgi:UDP-N-acetylmuramyl tripeptide synthase